MRLDDAERGAYARDGYLLRRGLFPPEEIAGLRSAAEQVVTSIVTQTRAGQGSREFRLAGDHRFQFAQQSLIQWEWSEGKPNMRALKVLGKICADLGPNRGTGLHHERD